MGEGNERAYGTSVIHVTRVEVFKCVRIMRPTSVLASPYDVSLQRCRGSLLYLLLTRKCSSCDRSSIPAAPRSMAQQESSSAIRIRPCASVGGTKHAYVTLEPFITSRQWVSRATSRS